MKLLWLELKKIAAQLRGSGKIFGYESTVANQLYLLYCFAGHIYFTDKVHKRVKYFWYGIVSYQLLYSSVISLEYLCLERKTDLMVKLHVLNFACMINTAAIIFPLIVYLCGDRIEALIQHVDDILMLDLGSGLKQKKIIADAKKYFALYLIPSAISYLVLTFASVPDVVLFYEEEKLSNSLYYAFPPPLIQKYTSMWLYLIATGIIFIVYALTLAQAWSSLGFVLYCSIIVCVQLTSTKNFLRSRTRDLNVYTDDQVKHSADWNGMFNCMLEHGILEFQQVTRMINYLRKLFEGIGTMLVINGLWIGMILLYTYLTNELLPVTKLKFLAGCMGTVIAVFLFYWAGQNLNNSVSEVTLAVYFTPWYRSVKVRKIVYIFLGQTQSIKNFAVFKVHGMQLNNIARYLHGQMSYTHVLRKLTMK
ncbi:uncharacterized protein LOC135842228 [Planococcus citri]|uniref:uncharacterized protein LOC135842228 n=1 Tax=Planococcus citri TaxID=170843 RepID=UPI0031F97AD2